MITEHIIEIDAPAARVWEVWADVESWHEWTESVERIVPLDGAGLAVGKRFEVKQPRFPRLVWEVTALEPGRSWTWQQRSFGALTLATHELRDGAARLVVDQRGVLGVLVGALMRGKTRGYLAMEAEGLRQRCLS